MVTTFKCFISILTAVDRDVSTNCGTALLVLPLADVGWTGSSVHTPDVSDVTYPLTGSPGAVTLSDQNPATNLAIDRGPLVLSNGRIGAEIRWKLLSCFSGGGQCDWFAATLFFSH